jgi:hypothetical protein
MNPDAFGRDDLSKSFQANEKPAIFLAGFFFFPTDPNPPTNLFIPERIIVS